MTGPSGNRLSICPLRFRIASPRVPIDLGCASVNRNSWGGDPESLVANRSAYYPRDQSLFVYYCSVKPFRLIKCFATIIFILTQFYAAIYCL